MQKFVINGGKKLSGSINLSGAKNAALKMIAAAILTNEECILTNVPDIADVHTMLKIIESTGAKYEWLGKHKLKIDSSKIKSPQPDPNLVARMRSSIVLAGPLLARLGKAEIAEPGGCVIGSRPVYEHWNALKKFGVEVTTLTNKTILECNKLIGNKIILDAMSVTATENVLMAAVLAEGTTEIRVAACEPEITDLITMLKKMGAKIKGENTHCLTIKGVNKLRGVEHTIIPDRIEAGTYALMAIAVNSDITIKNIIPDHMDILFNRLDTMGVDYKLTSRNKKYSDLHILPSKGLLHPIKIDARPYPGYPTDLQAPTAVVMTQLNKTSKIFETIFEGRFKYLDELKKMGAKINLIDSHTAEITGPTPLQGAKITSFDLRAGATLIIAGLIAKGTTEIDNIETIDRGYEDIEGKLRKLGADIRRINS